MQIPFYKNHGLRCAQTCMKCALGKVFPDKTFDIKTLENITGRKGNFITWPVQIAAGFQKLGVDFFYPVKPNFRCLNFDELKNSPGYEKPFSRTDFKSVKDSIDLIKDSRHFSEVDNDITLEQITDFIDLKKLIPIMLVNYDVLVGRSDESSGHYLVVTRIGQRYVYAHDTGPCNASADKRFLRENIQMSRNLNLIDHGLIFIPSI